MKTSAQPQTSAMARTYIAICKLHSGDNKTVWLRDCADFWTAVEKAKALPQDRLPDIEKPVCQAGFDHLFSARMHEWKKEQVQREIENDARIFSVEAIRPFMS